MSQNQTDSLFTNLPYNCPSFHKLYSDFKNMLWKYAIENERITHGAVDRKVGLSIAHDGLLTALRLWEPSQNYKGNTREGFGLMLNNTLYYHMQKQRTDYIKSIRKTVPQYMLSKEVADTLFGNATYETMANSDYGSEVRDRNAQISLQQVLSIATPYVEQDEMTIIRGMFGLDGVEYTLRGMSEVLEGSGRNLSHESVNKKLKSGLSAIRYAVRSDIKKYNNAR